MFYLQSVVYTPSPIPEFWVDSGQIPEVHVKQKRWPDWGLNPGPSRHIPDALTTELSGLYQQIN